MKDKTAAGILALFLGWLGFHRFYLGQTGLGIVYLIFCWFPLIWLIAFIDGIALLSMDEQRFNAKYNKLSMPVFGGETRDFERKTQPVQERRTERREPPRPEPVQRRPASSSRSNPYKQTGLEKFKDYDYSAAIADFKKSLELDPRDIATHFNLACAYSLTEDAPKAFQHLDLAVSFGFRDFQKIKGHHALAFLRVQPEFEDFEQNGFRQRAAGTQAQQENLLNTQPNLLDQLKKLDELRSNGMLTEQEFSELRRKLQG